MSKHWAERFWDLSWESGYTERVVDVLIRRKSVWQIDAKQLDGINSLNVRKKRWKEFIWKARATEENFFSFWCVDCEFIVERPINNMCKFFFQGNSRILRCYRHQCFVLLQSPLYRAIWIWYTAVFKYILYMWSYSGCIIFFN